MELWDAYREDGTIKFIKSDKYIQSHKERMSEYLDTIK